MSIEDNVNFLLKKGIVNCVNDNLEFLGIQFGDKENPKIFLHTENEDTVTVFVLENIYEDVEVGGSITDYASDHMASDLLAGKLGVYITLTFPKSEMGMKAIGSVIDNLKTVQEYLEKSF